MSQTLAKILTDPNFLMTMRGSSLYEAEEFDNALVFSSWHFLFETGLAQMKDYVANLRDMVSVNSRETDEKKKIPIDQLKRINDLINRFEMYDDNESVDSKKNIRIIRNYLRAYNQSLGYGIIMYDMHTALLNARYAENGGQLRKDLKEITKTMLSRGQEIQYGEANGHDRSFTDKLLGRNKH